MKEELLKKIFKAGDQLYSEKIYSDKGRVFPDCELLKEQTSLEDLVTLFEQDSWISSDQIEKFKGYSVIYNQGSYIYAIDIETEGHPVIYITIDSPHDIQSWVISAKKEDFLAQFTKVLEDPIWIKDNETLYTIRCEDIKSLQSWIKRTFVKKEAKVGGLLALALVDYYESVSFVGNIPEYSLLDLNIKKMTDKRFDTFLKNLKYFSRAGMKGRYKSFGEHGDGIILPKNSYAQSKFGRRC